MPTSETAPSAALAQKILDTILPMVIESGWTGVNLERAVKQAGVSQNERDLALPDGIRSLVSLYLESMTDELKVGLSALDLDAMRVRDRVTSGVRIWLEALSEHHEASVKAFDWCAARPLGPVPMTEFIWTVADAIWTGIGDKDVGFTYASKRTILSGVLVSTLAVWRKDPEGDVWPDFLDRRIADVMAFEKFKAKFRLPLPA